MTSPMQQIAQMMLNIPLDEMRAAVELLPEKHDACATCRLPIRSTPSVHKDGSVHWTSGGWEHTAEERTSCGEQYPYKVAQPWLNPEEGCPIEKMGSIPHGGECQTCHNQYSMTCRRLGWGG